MRIYMHLVCFGLVASLGTSSGLSILHHSSFFYVPSYLLLSIYVFFHSSGVFLFYIYSCTLHYSTEVRSKADNQRQFPYRFAPRSYSARSRFHSHSFCAPSVHSYNLPHSPRSYLEPDRTSERPSHTCRFRHHFVCF